MQAKVAELQSTNDSQLAKIHGLERQVGDAEQQAKDRASDLVCCETELAALKDGGAGSTAQARLRLLYHPRIPLFLSLPLALLKGGDAPACAGVAQVNQSCSACAEKDRKMTDIKEKAKVFVREKLASVQQHLLAEEQVALNIFCQYIYLWMYVIPAADLHNAVLQHHTIFVERVRALLAGGEPTTASIAIDETVILLHPPSTFSRCINSDGERASAK